LLLALCEKLDLYLMDRVPWVNMSKPPSPTYWACRKKVQLLAGHEMIFWLTNNPDAVRSCNQRVLQPHTESHSALVARGGENRTTIYGDGAHVVKPGAFSQSTDGAIPKNVIIRGHACADTRRFHQEAKRLGLPAHGAMFPTAIPDFFIRFLTEENELVVDPFAGSLKTGLAAERLNRRWMCFDSILEWLRISATGFFSDFPGFEMNPIIDNGELFA
ncbi:DNA methyltransferase, partial [Klebsiella pneumoniae]